MDPGLFGLGATLATASSGLAWLELHRAQARRRNWRALRLSFGRDVTPEAVTGVLETVAGLPRDGVVILDIRADHHEVAFELETDQATFDSLRGPLSALLPGLRFEPIERAPAVRYRWGWLLALRGSLGVLRDDLADVTSSNLLAALQPLAKNEVVLLRWRLAPGRARQLTRVEHGQTIEAEERRHLRRKNLGNVLRARGLIAVQAGHPRRAAHLLGRVTTVLRSRGTAYGQLRPRPRSGRWLTWLLNRRGLVIADRYSAAELAPLLAWPMNAPALPGVTLGTSPQRLPSARLPRSGRLLGTATWPGAERPIAQPVVGGLSHTLIAGPTGVGKSTLIQHLALADIAARRAVVLIDGKGDTAEAVLAQILNERRDDVVVLDSASAGALPGLKLFGGGEPELAADVVLGVLADLYRDSWGPLSERYLRAGLLAVAHDPEGTLADLPYVFTDAAYRRRLVGKLRDPLTSAVFAAFEAMGAAERQQQLAAALNKLSQLLGRPVVRTVLGQSKPQLDFRAVLRDRRIAVISLSPMRVGSAASRLLGALTVYSLFQAVQGRGALHERARRPAFIYLDEPRALGALPMPLDSLLEQARGLGVGLILAPQSLKQLPTNVRDALLTNVATRIVFRQDDQDALQLARDLPGVSPDDLHDLGAFEAVARIGLGPGDLAPPVTIHTAPPSSAASSAAAIRLASERRYGQTLQQVDAALDARHRASTAAPVGRTRRTA